MTIKFCDRKFLELKENQGQSPGNRNYRRQGTETTQQRPTPETHEGRTRTAKPTRREARSAKAAAAERERKNDQRAKPEKERSDDRTNQEQQPPARAWPTSRRNGTPTRAEPPPTQKEQRMSTTKKNNSFFFTALLDEGTGQAGNKINRP